MRPCTKCGTPVENRRTACPTCGTSTAPGPKPTPGNDPPPTPGLIGLLFGSAVPDLFSLAKLLLLAGVPLALGGLIGYAAAGPEGAVGGAVAAMVLAIGVRAWSESAGR